MNAPDTTRVPHEELSVYLGDRHAEGTSLCDRTAHRIARLHPTHVHPCSGEGSWWQLLSGACGCQVSVAVDGSPALVPPRLGTASMPVVSARLNARRRQVSRLLVDLASWAEHQHVHALALVGSYARGAERMASDVDVVVLTERLERYDVAGRWFQTVRPGARLARTRAWGPVLEQRYRLRSGLLVDVGLAPPEWAQVPLDPGTARVLRDGHRVLHDPHGMVARASAALERGSTAAPSPVRPASR